MKALVPLVVLLSTAAAAELPPLAGRSLDEALQLLQQQGLTLIYTTELVRPPMRVTAEPPRGRPEDVLAAILQPHGLTAQPGPGGRWIVVRDARAARPPAPRSTPPPISFRSELRVVRLEASVVDGRGAFVKGLGASDFEILEDGQPQSAVSFATRDMPISLTLLLDVSRSMEPHMGLSQAAAMGFLQVLRPVDEASVIRFDDGPRVVQAATSDAAALRAAIEGLQAGGATGLYNALYAALRDVPPPSGSADPPRRVIVLLSDGEDTASVVWEEQVVELARQREATLHVIDLGADAANPSSRLLRRLATETGGQVHRPRSARDLPAVYALIADELGSQYTIGYHSSSTPANAKWRRIEVRVRGRNDVRVRHRAGYYATP
jgi:Ca-activated chloride channel family protein